MSRWVLRGIYWYVENKIESDVFLVFRLRSRCAGKLMWYKRFLDLLELTWHNAQNRLWYGAVLSPLSKLFFCKQDWSKDHYFLSWNVNFWLRRRQGQMATWNSSLNYCLLIPVLLLVREAFQSFDMIPWYFRAEQPVRDAPEHISWICNRSAKLKYKTKCKSFLQFHKSIYKNLWEIIMNTYMESWFIVSTKPVKRVQIDRITTVNFGK